MEQVRNFFKKVIELIKRPETRILPGNLAFFFVMSIIPIVALIGALATRFSISYESIKDGINITVPGGVGEFITSIINGQGFTFNIGVFLVSAFILASNGMHSIIIASNEIYKIKHKDFLTRRIKAILMTIILVEILFVLLAIPVFGDTIFGIFRENINSQKAIDFFYRVYKLVKYPISLGIIYFNQTIVRRVQEIKTESKDSGIKNLRCFNRRFLQSFARDVTENNA